MHLSSNHCRVESLHRSYEVENLRKYRAGEMSDAELGLKNMAGAMKDPAAMAELAKMMKDPDTMRQVQQMMQDPSFQAQAKAAMQQMAASGAMPSQEQMQQMMNDPEMIKKAQAMAQAMGMGAGSMGAGISAGGAQAEINRLRMENAALKQQAGI